GGWRLHEPANTEDKPAEAPTPSSAGAVDSLLQQAEAEYQRGNYERAIATAERALRIDRRNGAIYLLLAQSYWQQALPVQSEQFARQGLRYSQSLQLTDALNKVLNEVAGRR
ncbi:MAG TPA: tetratricopeptide repeat protein, partial [Cellvibrionaceae bacterium]